MLRRPRFKPTANLTTRRAVPITVTSTQNDDINNEKNDEIISNRIEKNGDKDEENLINNKEKTTENGLSRRRLVKPSVNISTKRPKPVADIEKKLIVNDEKCENSFASEKVEKTLTEDIDVPKSLSNNITINNKAVANPTIDETCFKSPLALASYNLQSPNASRFTNKVFEQSLIMSPNHQHPAVTSSLDGIEPITRKEQQENYEEMLRGPMSPTKIRQRIRPTPCFGHRRNSIQGNSSEPEDEHNKRQRHYSTSSTYSNNSVNLNVYSSNINNSNNISNNQQIKLINGTINGMIKQANRIRTESSCSNISDLSLTRDIMTKSRNFRSEECQRMAEAKRDFRNRFIGDNKPDKSRLTMYDMIYYNPISNPMKTSGTNSVCGSIMGGSTSNQNNIKERRLSSASSTANSFISKKSMMSIKQEENSMPVPQLKLGPNGEMILDEKSLIIETTLDKEARDKLANADIIYDDEFSGNSGFYKRQRRSREWSAAETIKFYRCLHTIGTDFSLMITLFPKRTRRDLKLKFKKEERTNLQLVNKALMHPKHFNIEDLKLEFDKEEEEYDRNQIIEKEMKKKQISLKRLELEKLKSKLPGRLLSKAMRIMTGGDGAYEMENVSMRKRHSSNTKKFIPEEININCNDYIEKLPSFNNVKQFQMMSQQLTTSSSDIEINNNDNNNEIITNQSLTNIINDDCNTTNVIADITVNNITEEKLNNDIITKEDILNMEIIFDDTVDNNYLINNTNDIDNNNILIGNCNTECCNNDIINKTNEICIAGENADLKLNNTSNDNAPTKDSNRKIKRKPTINLLSRNKRSKLIPINEKGKLDLINKNEKLQSVQETNFNEQTDAAIDDNVDLSLLDTKVDEIEKQLQLFENETATDDYEIKKDNSKISIESNENNLNKDDTNILSKNTVITEVEINVNDGENLIENQIEKQLLTSHDEQKNNNNKQLFTSETGNVNLEEQEVINNSEKAMYTINDKISSIENVKKEDNLILDKSNKIIELETIINTEVMLHEKLIESDSSEINPRKIEENQLNLRDCENTGKVDNNDDDDNELIMIESIDPNNINNKLYEVYQINRKTGKLDEEPLEFPKEIMDKIRQC